MKSIMWSMIGAIALLAAPVFAQDKSGATNMQIMVDKVKADKKALVADNMDLTDTEARAFWPIYDQYQNELKVINDRLASTILAYADAYNAGSLPDSTAKRLLDEALAIDDSEVRLRRDYTAKLTRVIRAAKAARYLQIENKIRAAVRYELSANIPLVE
jgi:predicted DNA binding CopG/RHH family protein